MGADQEEQPGTDAGGVMHRLGEMMDGVEGLGVGGAYSMMKATAGVLGDTLPTGMKLAGEVGETVEHGGGLLGDFGKAFGVAGNVVSGISGAVNGYEAVEDFSKEGYHSDEAWDHVGGAILGGAGAATAALGPYAPIASAALGAGEIATDAVGAGMGAAFGKDAGFSADSVVGGMARGMFGDKSWGDSTRTAVAGGLEGLGLGETASNVIGATLGTAENIVAAPIQGLAVAGEGIAHEGEAIYNGIANGTGAVGHWLHDIF